MKYCEWREDLNFFENIIKEQLKEFLSTKDMSSDYQSGFRGKKTTDDYSGLKSSLWFYWILRQHNNIVQPLLLTSLKLWTLKQKRVGLSEQTICWFENNQTHLIVCRPVLLPTPFVYPRVYPGDQSWDHSHSLYLSTVLIKMFPVQISTFMWMILWWTALTYIKPDFLSETASI